jgi:phosphonate transport system permease protein
MTLTRELRLPVPPKPRRGRSIVAAGVLVAGLVAVHYASIRVTGYSFSEVVRGLPDMAEFFGEAIPADLSWTEVIKPGLVASLETLAVGLLGTTFSIPLALVLALLAARTTNRNRFVYQGARLVLSLLRAIPDFALCLIFITAVGLGMVPAVLAILLHNVGVMGKLWAEAMEEVDEGPIDALRLAGGSSTQVAAHAVVPSVVSQCAGLLLYRFDVNVRSALVLSLFGGFGLGFRIFSAQAVFQYDAMLTYILMVLVMVVLVDQLSIVVRRRLAG